MRAMVLERPGRPLVPKDVPKPKPGPGQVSIRVAACGVCRTEVLRQVLTDIANELRDRGVLDEEECFIDATFAMAKGGGAEIGGRNAAMA
jgi:threonine dehydrogenase-like Zn-dependent dehydrogenase